MNHYRQEINQDKAYIEAKPRTQQKQRVEIPGGPWGVKHHWNTLVEGSGVYMGTWPLKKRTHSYTKSSVWPIYILPFDNCAHLLLVVRQIPQSIHWIPWQQAASKKSLSEKYVHIPGCQKSGAFYISIKKNRASNILFVEKKGVNHIPDSAEKGNHSTRISVPFHNRKLPSSSPPHPPPPHHHHTTTTTTSREYWVKRKLQVCSHKVVWTSPWRVVVGVGVGGGGGAVGGGIREIFDRPAKRLPCRALSLSYTMVCAHVRCDNARAWASALSHVHAHNHSITDLSHLHACRPSTSPDISCWMLGI